MQNFTLGKKGYSMLLFALVLLIGSSPSFGQCPTTDGTESAQTFCYLKTVGDIVTDGSAVYQTADNTNDTQPIPDSQILDNGGKYWVGGQSGTCTRILVTTTVNSTEYPNNTLFPGENSFTISPCSSTFTAEELKSYFTAKNTDNDDTTTEFNIVVYEKEFGMAVATGPLTPNNSYFVGQVSTDTTPTPSENTCPSLRVAVGYDPQPTPAPTATSPQTFCEGATVANLQAQGTSPNTEAIRWYRTATSFQPLADNTLLINGETYHATQIINDRNDPFPPCESETRTPVEVIIQPATLNESTQSFCESLGEGNNFRKPQVQDLEPQGGTFYAESNSADPLDSSTELVEGEDYFNRNTGDDCTQDRITVVFNDTPNAGSTTQTTTCENETPFNLVDRINDSQLGEPDRDGTFSPALSTGTQIFNPADYAPGTYTFNYNVGSTSSCPDDTAVISVEVQAAPNAGPGSTTNVCSNDVPAILADPSQFVGLLPAGITPGGTFSPTLEQLGLQFLSNPSAPLATEYTVTSVNGCSDSATYTVNIIPSPNAGDDSSVTLSTQQDPVNLFTYIQGNPDTGGTFSPGNSNGDLDPADYTNGDYVFTYTVSSTNGCSDSSDLTVTITDQIICPDVIDDTQEFCESISDADGNNPRRPQVRDLMPMNTVWYATASSTDALAPTQTLQDNEDYFAGNANGDCPSRERVLVIIDDSPNAGGTTFLTVCANDEPFDLLDRYNPSVLGAPDAGGTIIPALASGTTIFDPSVDAARQYTYMVESTNDACPVDTSRITVNITEPTNANAGENVEESFCSNEGTIDLFTLIPDGVNTNGVFEGFENGQFDTAANIGENEIIYTVDDEEGCVIAGSATYTITVFEAPNAGPGADLNFCITEIQEMSTEEALAIFENLIPDDVTDGGDFSTSINDLIIQFTGNPIGEFSTTYTVSNDNCTDSATYSVTISDTEDADAGSDVDDLVFCSTDADLNLNDFLSDDASQNGYFEELENGIFSPSTVGVGIYTFTFTVDSSSDCVTGSDSATYTVEVLQGPDAGENGSVTLSTSDEPVNLFAYLNGTPEEGGLWNPGNSDGSFNPSLFEEGQFEFTYTVVSENECEASATVTVTITDDEIICPIVTDTEQAFCESIEEGNDSRLPRVSDLIPSNATWYATADSDAPLASTTVLINGEDYFAGNEDGTCTTRGRVVVTLDDSPNAGGTTFITVCADDEPFDLLSRMNSSILGAPDAGGTFTPALTSGTTIFDPSADAARQYVYTVQSTNAVCPDDESRITVTILQNEDANAGEDFAREFCIINEDVNLFDLLAEGVTMTGTFEGYVDGIFSPSTSGEGVFEITYNVGEDLPCVAGSASAIITITVTDIPDAPVADANQTFCVIDSPTVGDIVVTGENVVFFLDAELNDDVDSTTALTDDTVYYAVSTNDVGSCLSDAVMINVTVSETPAPTLSTDGDEFCRSDNPTVQDLINNFTGSGVLIYTSSTGGSSVAATTALENGVTYYGASVDGTTGCESSERTPVIAKVEFCGIPEGFSPNGDGINDRFVIPDIATNYPSYSIEIFNRWGNVVFKGNASTPDWDGISNQSGTLGNDVLPVGVYFYILNYNDGQTPPVQGKLYLSI